VFIIVEYGIGEDQGWLPNTPLHMKYNNYKTRDLAISLKSNITPIPIITGYSLDIRIPLILLQYLCPKMITAAHTRPVVILLL
jgi:hypothetical protein